MHNQVEQNKVNLDTSPESIDTEINKLAKKIDMNDPFEVLENWKFKLKLEWETLNIELTEKELINMYTLTLHIIKLYLQWNFEKDELFYSKEWFLSWWKNVWTKEDLYINNRPTEILDTVLLSQEWLSKNLPNKSEEEINKIMKKYSIFLNKIIKN